MNDSSTGDGTSQHPLDQPIAPTDSVWPSEVHELIARHAQRGPDPRYTAQELYRDWTAYATNAHADTDTPNFNFTVNPFDGSPYNESSPRHQATIPDGGSPEHQAPPIYSAFSYGTGLRQVPMVPGRVGVSPAEAGVPPASSQVEGGLSRAETQTTFDGAGEDARPGGRDAHATRDQSACRAAEDGAPPAAPEPEPAAPGRPADKDKATKVQAICAKIREHGYSDTAAAAQVEVTRSTVSRWKQDEEIEMLFDKARAEYQEPRLARIDDKRMKDGQHDWRAQAWLVKFSQPEEYGRPSSRRKLQDVVLPAEKTPEEVAEEEKEKKVAELVEGFAGWHVFPQTGVCYAEMETIQQMKQEVWLYHLWGLQDSEDGETDPAKAVEGATHLAAALRVEAELEHAENIFRAQMGAPLVDDELRAKRAAKRLASYEKSGRFPRDPSIPAYAHCIPREPKNVAIPPIIAATPTAGQVTHAAKATGTGPTAGPGPVPAAPGRAGVSPAEADVPPASPHVEGGPSRDSAPTTIDGPGEDARTGGRDARPTRESDALRANDAPENVALRPHSTGSGLLESSGLSANPPLITPPEGGTRRIRRREIRAARLQLAREKAQADSLRRAANMAKYEKGNK